MLTRRRFLAISAAVAMPRPARAAELYTATGQAIGARVTLRLQHPDAPAIAAQAMAEIARLEDVFSLYRTDSSLARLNATGQLEAPPFELLACLTLAGSVHAATEGLFDPTVQPLWALYAAEAVKGSRPDAKQIAAALALIGWQKVRLGSDRIDLQPGMALTLNGIAQGYIADRVADLLAGEGLDNILIDTGELRALGGDPRGGDWQVKLAQGCNVALKARSLATSAPLGTTFDQLGIMGHILDPRSGLPAAPVWRAASISAPSAALADALSTAACLTKVKGQVQDFCKSFAGTRIESLMPA